MRCSIDVLHKPTPTHHHQRGSRLRFSAHGGLHALRYPPPLCWPDCALTSWLYIPAGRPSSSLWVPSSTTLPFSSTTILSADSTVLIRCATTNVVRFRITSASAAATSRSVALSSADVPSSKIKIRGSIRMARAIAIRCFCGKRTQPASFNKRNESEVNRRDPHTERRCPGGFESGAAAVLFGFGHLPAGQSGRLLPDHRIVAVLRLHDELICRAPARPKSRGGASL